ncbi:TatD family hydrolase [Ureaplasma ceti]|uniref:TatD family hydrolase n=1 Tax=Ureaplasma ceti TaxID=3119530 RepID=A0ABP9U6D0_9BACT
MRAYDTHTHTNVEPLDQEFQAIKQQLEDLNLYANIVGYDVESNALAIEQSKLSKNLFCALAIHPNDVGRYDIEPTLQTIEEQALANREKVVAIGECGLDYYYNNDEATVANQKVWFRRQIELAKKLDLPVNMHIRNAHKDAQAIIAEYANQGITFIVHCFTSNKEDSEAYVKLGCYISIPGVVTFKNGGDIREALSVIPRDKLLSETDAPWLAPVPHRGKTNYPYYVLDTNKFLANELNMEYEELSEMLFQNAVKAFKIKW